MISSVKIFFFFFLKKFDSVLNRSRNQAMCSDLVGVSVCMGLCAGTK